MILEFLGWLFSRKTNEELIKERQNLLIDDFIAEEKGYYNLLNELGLSLLMSLFADKEKDINQPIVAAGSDNLERAVKIFVQCDVGTEMTIIYIACGNHKLVVHLHKTADKEIKIICMDSISDNLYRMELHSVLNRALPKDFIMTTYVPNYPKLGKDFYFSIQSDFHQCGTFACKLARVFSKHDSPEVEKMIQNTRENSGLSRNETVTYEIPAAFLKSTQNTYTKSTIDQFRLKQQVNPRKGYTLENILKRHSDSHYINHFTEKYYFMVMAFASMNSISVIKKTAAKYNAQTIDKSDIENMNKRSRGCKLLSTL